MGSSMLRLYLVAVGGFGFGAWLVASTTRQLRRREAFRRASGPLHISEAVARLTFGIALVIVATLLLAGRILTTYGARLAAPGWVTALSTGLLMMVAGSGIAVLMFHGVRCRRPWHG